MDLSFNSLKTAWTDVTVSLSEAGGAFKSLVLDDFSEPMPSPRPYDPSAHNHKTAQQVHLTSKTTGNYQQAPRPTGNNAVPQNGQPPGQGLQQKAPINQPSSGLLNQKNFHPNGGMHQAQPALNNQNGGMHQAQPSLNHQQSHPVYEPFYAPSPSFPSASDQLRAALQKSAAPKSTEQQQSNGASNDRKHSIYDQPIPLGSNSATSRHQKDNQNFHQNTSHTTVPQHCKPAPFTDEHGTSGTHTMQRSGEQTWPTSDSNHMKSLPQYYKPTPFVAQPGQSAINALRRKNDLGALPNTSIPTNSLPQHYKPTPLVGQSGISATSGALSKDGHSITTAMVASDLNRTKSVPDLQRANSSSGFSSEYSGFQRPSQHKPARTRSSWQDLNLHKSTPDLRRSGISPGPGYVSPGAVVLSRKNSVGSRPRAWRSLSRGPTPSQV